MTDEGGDPTDRRSAPRKRVVRAAIVAQDSDTPIPCILLDLSDNGARLHLHVASEAPDRFWLSVEAENILRQCDVMWRREHEIGIKFVSQRPATTC